MKATILTEPYTYIMTNPSSMTTFRSKTRLFESPVRSVLLFLLLLAISPCTPHAGERFVVKHGTVVVIFFSKDRVVLAADSRLTFSGRRQGNEDNQCKISDLGEETIFAGSGVSGYNFGPGQRTPVFDAYAAALQTARTLRPGAHDRAKAVAEGWAKKVKAALDGELVRHPEEVMASMHGSSNLLASGVFAGKTSDSLVVYFAAVNCECSGRQKFSSVRITQLHPTDDGLPLASVGTAETMGLFSEVVDASSDRGVKEVAGWNNDANAPDRDAQVTVKTAEFILHHSKDHTIGGPINAIELDQNGQVHWVRKEKSCKFPG